MNISRLISLDVLIEHSGISTSTIKNGVSKTGTQSWIYYNIGTTKFVDYDSIPSRTKSKLNYDHLLSYDGILKELYSNQKLTDDLSFIELQILISIKSENNWRPYVKDVKDYARSLAKTQELARKYSLWNCIIHLKNSGFTEKEIWLILNSSKEIQSYKFTNYKSYPHFTQLIKKGESEGIDEVVINDNFGRTNEKRRKLTPWHIKKILQNYINRSNPISQIAYFVNIDAIKSKRNSISQSSVYKFLSRPEIKNRYQGIRYGKSYAQAQLFPYLIRDNPQYCDDAWEADGMTLPFYVLLYSGEIIRPTLYYILDLKSLKILAYEVAEQETFHTVIKTFTNAFKNTNRVPYEIIIDNSSAVTSSKFMNFRDNLLDYTYLKMNFNDFDNSTIRNHKPGNPKDKGRIEKTNDTLSNNFLRKREGYLYSMSTKSIDRTITKFDQDQAFKKPYSLEEIKDLVAVEIANYNYHNNDKGKCPYQIYYNDAHKNSFQISEYDIIRITSELVGERKVIRGTINVDKTKYQMKNFEKWVKTNNTIVKIHREYGSEEIYVFDRSDRFIQKLKPVKYTKVYGPEKNKKSIMGHSQVIKSFNRKIEKAKKDVLFNQDFINE